MGELWRETPLWISADAQLGPWMLDVPMSDRLGTPSPSVLVLQAQLVALGDLYDMLETRVTALERLDRRPWWMRWIQAIKDYVRGHWS